jgi:hypothetical protein
MIIWLIVNRDNEENPLIAVILWREHAELMFEALVMKYPTVNYELQELQVGEAVVDAVKFLQNSELYKYNIKF